jgi:hypothetical protein
MSVRLGVLDSFFIQTYLESALPYSRALGFRFYKAFPSYPLPFSIHVTRCTPSAPVPICHFAAHIPSTDNYFPWLTITRKCCRLGGEGCACRHLWSRLRLTIEKVAPLSVGCLFGKCVCLMYMSVRCWVVNCECLM